MNHGDDCSCDQCLSHSFAEGGEVSQFDTPLNPGDELLFQQWKAQYAPNDSGHDYDLRGAWKAGLLPGADGHWSDQFKKPNHPTFSDESQYAGQGYPGSWDKEQYTPFQGYKQGGPVKNFAQGGLADALRYFGLDSLASAWEDSHDTEPASHVAAAVEPGLGGRISYHDVPPASVAAKAAKAPGVMDSISGGLDLPFKTLGNMAEARGASPALSTAAYALPQLMGFDSLPAVGKATRKVGRAAAEGAPGFLEKLMATNPTLNFALRPDQVVKPRGGNWMHYEVPLVDHPEAKPFKVSGLDTNLESIKDNINSPSHERMKAMSGWSDKQLRKYLMTNWGTADDPLADMLVRGDFSSYGGYDIEQHLQDIAQSKRQLTPEEIAKIDDRDHFTKSTIDNLKAHKSLGQGNVVSYDKSYSPHSFYSHRKGLSDDLYDYYNQSRQDLKHPEWVDKLPDSTALHDLATGPGAFHTTMNENLGQLWDYFNTLTPQQINNMGVPDAFRNSKAYHDALAKRMTDDPIAAGGADLHKEYPDTGFKWLKLHSDEALNAEGKMMGHCVGSYCDQVKSGSSQIYSLRDKEGRSHVTIEVNPPDNYLSGDRLKEKLGAKGGEIWNDYRSQFSEDDLPVSYRRSGNSLHEFMKENYPEEYTRMFPSDSLNIRQIKGKQNKAPVKDYVPYVQDFIKSGKWGDIGDLDHAEMVNLADAHEYKIREEWGDHLVNAFHQHIGRNPSNHELDMMAGEVAHQLGYGGNSYHEAGSKEISDRISKEADAAAKQYASDEGYAQGGLVAKDIAMDPDALESLFLLHHE